MRNKLRAFFILASLLVFSISAAEQGASESCPVTLVAQGVQGTKGVIGFVVFASKNGWPEKHDLAFRQKATAAKPGDVSVVIPDMKPGRYAIAMIHDENENKRIDKKPSGRPREGWGVSNNLKATLKPPGFEAATVEIKCGARVAIKIQYPGAAKE